MRTKLILAVLAAGWLLANPAWSRDIFVSNRWGDDRSTGDSARPMPNATGPVATIGRALSLVLPGDRVVVENTGTPYRESLSLTGSRHSGWPSQPLVIEGNGAVLDGSAPIPPDAWKHYRGATFRFQPPRVEFQQLFLNDRPVERVVASTTADEPPALKPLQWTLHGAYIYFAVEQDKLPRDYALTYAALPVGITLFRVDRVTIRDLVVQGFHRDGVNAFNSVRQVELEGLTCRGNGRSGIAVGGASVVSIQACLVGNNGFAQLLTLPYSETHVHNSEMLSNTAPGWVDQGGKVMVDGKAVEGGLDRISPPAANAEPNAAASAQ